MKKVLCLLLVTLTLLISSCARSYVNKAEEPSFNYTKDGVDSFYSLLETKMDSHIEMLKKENCYNITTDNLKPLDVEIFKFKDQCDTYLQYKNEIYDMGSGFGGYGFINAVTCDIDNNETPDILYTFSYGSGVHRSVVSVFNMSTLMVTDLFTTIDESNEDYMADLVLEKTMEEDKAVFTAYSATINFTNDSIANSYVKKNIYKSINLTDYSNCKYFDVKVYNNSVDTIYTKPNENNLSLNFCKPINMQLTIPSDIWNLEKDNLDLIKLSYDDDFFDIFHSNSNDSTRTITYIIYPMKKFESKEIVVEYDNVSYTLDISCKDYDFSYTSKVTEDELNTKYSEFREMMDSILYHEYTTPYPGITSYGGSSYWKEYEYRYSFDEEYDLGYLDYLKDSVYYPSKMDLAYPNIGIRSANMMFNDLDIIKPNTEKARMALLYISYFTIDPDCTNPTNPIDEMSFVAVPLNYSVNNTLTQKKINDYLYQTYYLLKDAYPEQYLNYQVGDINIKLIKIGDTLKGFFEDDNYAYMLSSRYDFNRVS